MSVLEEKMDNLSLGGYLLRVFLAMVWGFILGVAYF